MLHYMTLNAKPFSRVRTKNKTIELRLNDPKRQAINVGDIIIFTNAVSQTQTLTVKVEMLHHFGSFDELYQRLPLDKCGYTAHEIENASPKDMTQYYSLEEQRQYGVVGIEFSLIRFTEGA